MDIKVGQVVQYMGIYWTKAVELPGRRKRGKPQSRFIDVLKEDMQMVGVTEQDAREMELTVIC